MLADRVAVMSCGRVVADVPVPLERPRRRDMRYGAQFNTLCAHLRKAMDAGQSTDTLEHASADSVAVPDAIHDQGTVSW
jgi:ABC-type nitrate/sulfonate/bicarbonate transport system ATPase subunit